MPQRQQSVTGGRWLTGRVRPGATPPVDHGRDTFQMTTSDQIPLPLQSWLKANGKGELADAGFRPLVAFTLGTGQQGMPPAPDDVLAIWGIVLAADRIMVLQGSMALIRQARRAGKSDGQVRRMLLLSEDVPLDGHVAKLQREVEDIQTRMTGAALRDADPFQ